MSWGERIRKDVERVNVPVALVVGAAVLLFLAFWSRSNAFGLSSYLCRDLDVLSFDPRAPLPSDHVVGTYVASLRDPDGAYQVGNILDAWPRKGLPDTDMPAVALLQRGTIDVPEDGVWHFGFDAKVSRLWIDDTAVDPNGVRLPAGAHRIQFALAAGGPTDVNVTAGTTSAATIPGHWLLPESGAPVTPIVLAVAALLAFAAAVVLLARAPDERLRAREVFRAAWPVLVVIAALLLGTMLRARGRLAVPRGEHTWDEYYEAFHGISLLNGEEPRSWGGLVLAAGGKQWFDEYPEKAQRRFYGRNMVIVAPFVDYPPGFALLVGFSAKLDGVSDIFRVPLEDIRRTALVLSMFFFPLCYAIGRRLFGRPTASLATLVLAVNPAAVILMKFAKADLLVALLAFVSLWAGLRWREATREKDARAAKRWLVVCGLAAGLCPWAKQLGIFALVFPPLLLGPTRFPVKELSLGTEEGVQSLYQRLKPSLRATAIALGCLFALLVWFAFWNWGAFRAAMAGESNRIGGFHLGASFLEVVFLCWQRQQLMVYAGGWLLQWLACFWCLRGRGSLLASLAFLYLAVLVCSVDGRYPYGWYEIPFFLPLAITTGAFFVHAIRRPNIGNGMAILCLGVLPFLAFTPAIAPPDAMGWIRELVVIALAPLAAATWFRLRQTQALARVASSVLVAAFLGACTWASWQADWVYYLATHP